MVQHAAVAATKANASLVKDAVAQSKRAQALAGQREKEQRAAELARVKAEEAKARRETILAIQVGWQGRAGVRHLGRSLSAFLVVTAIPGSSPTFVVGLRPWNVKLRRVRGVRGSSTQLPPAVDRACWRRCLLSSSSSGLNYSRR